MAIQLPKVQKNDVYNAASNLPQAEATGAAEGYNIEVANIKAISSLGETYLKNEEKRNIEAQKQLDAARKNRAKDLANEYNKKVDKITAGFSALTLGGDLKLEYEKLKADQEDYKNELMKLAYDEETKALLTQEFSSQDAVLNKAIEIKYAQANVAYRTRVGKEFNDTLKKKFILSSSFFNPNDPTSTLDMDEALIKMDLNTLDYAQGMGLATVDSAGQPVYPDSITKDLENQKSEAVRLSISSLVGVGDISRATALFNRYNDKLVDKDRDVIKNQLVKANNERDHHLWAETIMRKDPEEQQKELNNIGSKFGIERQKRTGDIIASLKADRDRINREINQKRFNEGYNIIIKNQNNPANRWFTPEQMRQDPTMSQIYEASDYATRKKLDNLIKKPDFSDPEAVRTATTYLNRPNGLKGMSEVQLEEITGPLNQTDTTKIKNRWSQDNGLAINNIPSEHKTNVRNLVKKYLDEANMLAPKSSGWSSILGGSPSSADKNKVFFDKYEERVAKDLEEVIGEYPPNSPRAYELAKELTAKYAKEAEQNKKSFFDWFKSDEPTQQPTAPQKVTPAPVPTTSNPPPQPVTDLNQLTPQERARKRRELAKKLKGNE